MSCIIEKFKIEVRKTASNVGKDARVALEKFLKEDLAKVVSALNSTRFQLAGSSNDYSGTKKLLDKYMSEITSGAIEIAGFKLLNDNEEFEVDIEAKEIKLPLNGYEKAVRENNQDMIDVITGIFAHELTHLAQVVKGDDKTRTVEELEMEAHAHEWGVLKDAGFAFEDVVDDLFGEVDERQYEFTEEQLSNVIKGSKKLSPADMVQFDKTLHKKLEKLLKKVYPEIELKYTADIPDQYRMEYYQKDSSSSAIKGVADLEALSVLINTKLMSQDTLPHEYAHHYISWFRDSVLVQEAIKKWGSEEALVQAIGEQVVKQKGEAYGWWKEFSSWVMNLFNKLSSRDKEELKNLLTEAFLDKINIYEKESEGYEYSIADAKTDLAQAFEKVNTYRYSKNGIHTTLNEFTRYMSSIFPDSVYSKPYAHLASAVYNGKHFNNGYTLILKMLKEKDYGTLEKSIIPAVKRINQEVSNGIREKSELQEVGKDVSDYFWVDSDGKLDSSYYTLIDEVFSEYKAMNGWQWGRTGFSREHSRKGLGGNYNGDNFYFAPLGNGAFSGAHDFLVKLNAKSFQNDTLKFGLVPNTYDTGYFEAVVNNPDAVHIFGSDKDIKQFKEWQAGNNNTNSAKIEAKQGIIGDKELKELNKAKEEAIKECKGK